MKTNENSLPDIPNLNDIGLRYISSCDKGYRRITTPKGFQYLNATGNQLKDLKTIERIQKLAIPPAWEQVWICPSAKGHLQATGIDARGRKQYRYHPQWTALRSKDKFNGLYPFGQLLSRLEKQITRDLRRKKISKERVCALALSIMAKTYFRIGNDTYQKQNKSYGLTTLQNRHLQQISTQGVFFRFVGKKGIVQKSTLREQSLVRLLKKVKEIPGQRLFQYYDDQGEVCHLYSGDLNQYLKEATGAPVTCKVFRTWYANILALHYCTQATVPTNANERKHYLINMIDYVAQKLGNTRTVTRSHYIHPIIVELLSSGKLDPWIVQVKKRKNTDPNNPAYKRKLLKLIKANDPT